MLFFQCLLLFLAFHYLIQFLKTYLAWVRIPLFSKTVDKENISFSLVIALRNEEQNIPALFEMLRALDYSKDKLEIILIDDFSEDGTLELLKAGLDETDLDLSIFSLREEKLDHQKAFKKRAIQFGVSRAKHEWIATTDADCKLNPAHFKALQYHVLRYNPKFISAPVIYSNVDSFFKKMQHIEFSGLVALGASYIERNKPFLCNGANLAFPKSVFQNLNGYQGIDQAESGDDVWFMHKVQERYPFELHFAKNILLRVETQACASLNEFLNQRKRWTAKNASYPKLSQLVVLALDYLFYLLLLVSLVLGIFNQEFLELGALALGIKVLAEVNLYAAIYKFFKLKKWWFIYLLSVPWQLLYVVLIYPLSQLTMFEWKNRKFDA